MENTKYFGLAFLDYKPRKEDILFEAIGDRTNIFFIGATAGYDMDFYKHPSIVFGNGKYYTNAAVLALFKSRERFGIEKIESVVPMNVKVVANKVDSKKRIIYELDNRPAIDVWCEKYQITREEAAKYYSKFHLALMIDKKPFIRTLKTFNPTDGSIEMYSNIKEGSVLELYRSADDLIEKTKEQLQQIKEKYDNISGILQFNCVFRYTEAKGKNVVKEYGELFSDFPTIGFVTYGEFYIGYVNHTATMLIFQ
jgi:hypothetical protein